MDDYDEKIKSMQENLEAEKGKCGVYNRSFTMI